MQLGDGRGMEKEWGSVPEGISQWYIRRASAMVNLIRGDTKERPRERWSLAEYRLYSKVAWI